VTAVIIDLLPRDTQALIIIVLISFENILKKKAIAKAIVNYSIFKNCEKIMKKAVHTVRFLNEMQANKIL